MGRAPLGYGVSLKLCLSAVAFRVIDLHTNLGSRRDLVRDWNQAMEACNMLEVWTRMRLNR